MPAALIMTASYEVRENKHPLAFEKLLANFVSTASLFIDVRFIRVKSIDEIDVEPISN